MKRQNNIAKTVQSLAYRHSAWQVFTDFVEMASISISNQFDLARFDKREARYMEIVKGYEKDELAKFPEMLGELTLALRAGPADILGCVFHELELHNKWKGQFFTPFEISSMMARMTVSGDYAKSIIDTNGFITAMEPACGSGSTVIAFADVLKQDGIDIEKHLHITAVDLDLKCVHMAYMQLSILGIPAMIVHGNSLSLEEFDHWFTPAHVLGGWSQKLKPKEDAPAEVEAAA